MDDEGSIGLVLARATELRLKIGNCATAPGKLGDDYGDEEEESQRLVTICDALESLESQLSSLQCLQQQQRFEREVALGEIEQSREKLLEKLKEYKGEALDVIKEASAFVGETVDRNNDLLLPPYPSRPPNSLRSDNGYLPHLPSMHKVVRNGVLSDDQANRGKKKKTPNDSEQNKNSRGFGFFVSVVAKTVFTVVGVVSVLSLSGFGPKLVGRENTLKILGFLQQPTSREERSTIKCPPGKVLVVENGEARCLVKERVEVPFFSAVTKPDVNYGSG